MLHAGTVHLCASSGFITLVRDLGLSLADRVAVMASGSNAAPAQLANKCGAEASIPVARVEAVDTAIVYSSHISGYGSIPATRIAHSGSSTMVHVTMLDEVQLAAVDASEGSYQRVSVVGSFATFLGPVHAYESWRGQLEVAGGPIRVAEVPATSDLRAGTQIEALDLVAALTGCADDGLTLSQLVASGAIDAEDVNRLIVD